IVDNGSAAANARLLADMVQRLGGKYIRNDQNRWFAAANNQGLAVATGRVIVFLNNDIAADPIWLDSVRRDVQPGGLYGPGLGDISIDGRKLTYIAGWCVAARREEFDRLGGWDAAAYEMPYWEDADLSLRAARAGLRLIHTGWALEHKRNGTAGSVPGLRFAFRRNGEIFLSRIRGGQGPAELPCHDPHEFIRAGRVAEAERIYSQAVQREPNRADLWTKYAQVLQASARFEAAEQALRQAISLDPNHVDAYDSLGMLYLRTHRPAEAASQFRTVTQLNPASAEAAARLGLAFSAAGNYMGAIEVCRHALQFDRASLSAGLCLSDALRETGNAPEALAVAEATRQFHAAIPDVYRVVGMALRDLGRLDEARKALEHSLSLNPHSGPTLAAYQSVLDQFKTV